MGERKVLNKYIPADFDPSLVPKGKKLSSKDGTVPVRMMLPFSIQCSTCHTFLYRGRKFNSKKEAMGGPDGKYLGITRWRFYIKCTHCSRPITFLTDPQNADYEMESGGTRNYEVHKDREKTEEVATAEREQSEKEDPMKALENRVLDSQREMADLDNLEEIKAMNARHVKLMAAAGGSGDGDFDADTKAVLMASRQSATAEAEKKNDTIELTAEDEELVKSIQFGAAKQKQTMIRRLNEEDEKKMEEKRQQEVALMEQRSAQREQRIINNNNNNTVNSNNNKQPAMPIIIKAKRKRTVPPKQEADKKHKSETNNSNSCCSGSSSGLAGLLGGYGSDDSSSD